MSKFDVELGTANGSGLVTREVEAGDLVEGWAGVSISLTNDPAFSMAIRVVAEEGREYEVYHALTETNDVEEMVKLDDVSGAVGAGGDTGIIESDRQGRGFVLRVDGPANIELSVIR